MPKIDPLAIPSVCRTSYPMPFAADMARRHFRQIGAAGGLTQFGANLVTLRPGGVASQRHWHDDEDELVVMLSGEAVLEEEGARTPLSAGDIATFAKGVANGHRLVNESAADCTFLAIGPDSDGDCHYPDVDLHWDGAAAAYRRKDGTPY